MALSLFLDWALSLSIGLGLLVWLCTLAAIWWLMHSSREDTCSRGSRQYYSQHTHTHHAHCLNIRLYFRFCKQKQNIFFSIFVVPSPHCLCCCCIFFLLFFFFFSSSLSQMSSRAEPLHLDELSVPVDCVDCVYLNVVFAKVKQSCL